MRDFDTLSKLSRGSFTYAKFAQLKQIAKNAGLEGSVIVAEVKKSGKVGYGLSIY